ncbi:hypothetical protein HLB44_05555 [Aquincola sp. S2]|uniref:Uncharacterized protein n=1 Tax=Pseudaquabacterium terrae TaxID=2732868 RepID=A0ABX2ECD4_9BURK|nr:hypothetical protein [Aquabacterium terrae]NRF66442.1 hypothetical protein [Aquabacterium terrae]
MPTIDTAWLFTLLGSGLFVLGAVRCLRDLRLRPPGITWMTVGAIFILMSAFLHSGVGQG